MAELLPRVEISFEPADYESFVIEELTFNPFITTPTPQRRPTVVDFWMEFVIRRTVSRATELFAAVPQIVLRLNETFEGIEAPTCRIPTFRAPDDYVSDETYDDMNFVMHCDVWYSFVRLGDKDREFMVKGYNQPIRILYPCCACEENHGEHVNDASWLKGNNHLFSHPSPWEQNAGELLAMMTFFNERVVHSKAQETLWEDLKLDIAGQDHDVRRLKNRREYAPVYFQTLAAKPRARFAIRRLPWKIPSGQSTPAMYGVSYGGTAITTGDEQTVRLMPVLFSSHMPTHENATLGVGEAIRFWVRWQSRHALQHDYGRDRFSFAYALLVHPKLQRFNVFCRVPEGFDCVPGGELKHYPVPPRLFFLWNHARVRPEQCFASNECFGDKQHTELDLVAEFVDKGHERKVLVNLFLLTFLVNLMVNIGMRSLYQPPKEGSLAQKLQIQYAPFVIVIFLIIAGVQEYRKKPVRWIGLVSLMALGWLLPVTYQVSGWAAAIVVLSTFLVFLWTFGSLPSTTVFVRKHVWARAGRVKKWWARRSYRRAELKRREERP